MTADGLAMFGVEPWREDRNSEVDGGDEESGPISLLSAESAGCPVACITRNNEVLILLYSQRDPGVVGISGTISRA